MRGPKDVTEKAEILGLSGSEGVHHCPDSATPYCTLLEIETQLAYDKFE